MKTIKAKAIIAVEIPAPTFTPEQEKSNNRNIEVRNYVENSILDALNELSPKIQRLNLSRKEKEQK